MSVIALAIGALATILIANAAANNNKKNNMTHDHTTGNESNAAPAVTAQPVYPLDVQKRYKEYLKKKNQEPHRKGFVVETDTFEY